MMRTNHIYKFYIEILVTKTSSL